MTPPIERRSTLTKASVSDDLVAGLTSGPEPARQVSQEPTRAPERRPQPVQVPAAPRRGPGRPRGRRRMEQFSSKIEISLRDDVDAYAAKYGESYVDLLDRALRAAIAQPPPDA